MALVKYKYDQNSMPYTGKAFAGINKDLLAIVAKLSGNLPYALAVISNVLAQGVMAHGRYNKTGIEKVGAKALNYILNSIARDSLNAPNGDHVFKVCVKWAKYNKRKFTPLVELSLQRRRCRLFSKPKNRSRACMYIYNAIETQLKEDRATLEYRQGGPYLAGLALPYHNGELFLIGVLKSPYIIVQKFNSRTGRWNIWHTFSMKRANCTLEKIVFLKERFYIFYFDERTENIYVDVYDIQKKLLSELPSPAVRRAWLTIGVLKDKIYICGGVILDRLDSHVVECFNPEIGRWRMLSSMPADSFISSVAAWNGKLFVCGGANRFKEKLQTVHCYDPAIDVWTQMQPMNNCRSNSAAAVMNDKLYIVGGTINYECKLSNNVEVYDPILGTWEQGTPMKYSRSDAVLVPFNGELWVIGNHNGQFAQRVEIYNSETKNWRFGPILRKYKWYCAAGVIF